MSFPERRYDDAGRYADAYFSQLDSAYASVSRPALQAAAGLLLRTYENGGMVYTCGNGGSASIANQLVSDHCKLIQTDTELRPRAYSLSATIEIITALANDLSYADVFVYQLRTLARPGDLLLTISSSGDSENIVRAVKWAKENGIGTLCLTGFSGGRSAEMADVGVHVAADNYGVVEDVHQSLMHVLAQYIRQANMEAATIRQRKY